MHTITPKSSKPESARISHSFSSKLVVDDNNLYLISSETNNLQISRVSTDGDMDAVPFKVYPFLMKALLHKLGTSGEAAKETYLFEGSEKAHHAVVSIVPPPIRGKGARTRIVVSL